MCHHGNCPWQVRHKHTVLINSPKRHVFGSCSVLTGQKSVVHWSCVLVFRLQVSLLNSKGVELCGAVVLGRRSVLTSAHCLLLDSESDLRPSNFYIVAGTKPFLTKYYKLNLYTMSRNMRKNIIDEFVCRLLGNHNRVVPVRALYVHDRFRPAQQDNDLALLELAAPLSFGPGLIQLCLPTKDFSENILMHSGRLGIAEQQGGGQDQDLVYMTLDECRSQLNVSHPLSNKMFCMMKQNRIQGGPDELTGNQNGAPERPNGSLRNRNKAHTRGHFRPRVLYGSLGNHNGDNNQTGVHGTQNGPENQNSSISESSEDGGRRCGGVLPGAPVATEEKGTAYLTGLMMSSSSGCDAGGLVFTKLSRYLSWIRPRMEAAENHMTPQINEYPENR